MCILWQTVEVSCVVCQELLISCDKGLIAALNKKCHQWDVRSVLPIGGIFAEYSTRHPSDKKSFVVSHTNLQKKSPLGLSITNYSLLFDQLSSVVGAERKGVFVLLAAFVALLVR